MKTPSKLIKKIIHIFAIQTQLFVFFPLGVYWPWETTNFLGDGKDRIVKLRPFLKERLEDLRANHVNMLWVVNGPYSNEETALLCRLAKEKGIQVLIGNGKWLMTANQTSDAWIAQALREIRKVWRSLDVKSRPFGFAIADEPRAAFMPMFEKYAAALKKAKIPATTTVMHNDIEAAAEQATSLPWLSVDFYPFYGSPHGPQGDPSYFWYQNVVRRMVESATKNGQSPWVMAQAYQEIVGPSQLEKDGTVTVLPGAERIWNMPTVEQIHWQTWTAAALGAKGIFFFSYGVPFLPDPKAPPKTELWVMHQVVPTKAPMSLVSVPDFKPSPQFFAMGESFAKVESVADVLTELVPTSDEPLATFPKGTSELAGDLVRTYRHRTTNETFVVAVASPKRTTETFELQLSSVKYALEPVKAAPAPTPTRNVATYTLKLNPGDGALYRLRDLRTKSEN